MEQKLPCNDCDKDGYTKDIADHSSVLKLFVDMHKPPRLTTDHATSRMLEARLQTNCLIRSVYPSAPCAIASPVSGCGTGMAGIRAGAPRQAPALKPSLTSLKMVRRFCAITFSHAIFPIMGK